MKEKLHEALNAVIPHVSEGSQIFVLDRGTYHRFRVDQGEVSHTGTHSNTHVETGRGTLQSATGGSIQPQE